MEILYCDDRVIVCVKPAGVLSTDEPGGMPELLRGELGDEGAVVKSVHRLDRTVGGVMVYARTKRAAADLENQILYGTFEKSYLAVVHGVPKENNGSLRHSLLRDRSARRTLVVPAGTAGAQEARLDYSILEKGEGLSLLLIRLHTGRTHQIRCQMSHIGHPIAGDRKYGDTEKPYSIALWSYEICFEHPRTGAKMVFHRAPPEIEPWSEFSWNDPPV
jgi:23S rRNA pseudouridine1911/1915/1917 synthase